MVLRHANLAVLENITSLIQAVLFYDLPTRKSLCVEMREGHKGMKENKIFKQSSNYERWRLYVVRVDKYGMDV